MTQDEIIDMAKQAGFKHPNPHDGYMGLAYDRRDGTDTGPSLAAFAKLVAAKERDRIIAENKPELDKCNAYIKELEDKLSRGEA